MTIKTNLMATTAAMLITAGGAVYADGHATHPETGETLASEQVFTYRDLDESPSIDPGKAEDTAGGDIIRDLFEGLMGQDAEGNLIPAVATGYTVSDDNLVYTFTLRDNAKWSNGEPVTAGDFEYGWKRAADPATASPYSWYIELTTVANASEVIAGDMDPSELGIKAIDDTTLEITLTQPLPYFPDMTTHYTLFPVPQATIEEFGDEWTKPGNMVSNGAYVLTEHVPQERLVRERNEMYWDNENTIIDKTVSLIIPDENVALTRFLAGELDRTEVPAGQFPRLAQEYPDDIMSVPQACSYYYTINLTDTTNPALLDPKVRQALSLAVNRDVIVDNVLAGGQKAAYTFTHWATAGFETPETPIAAMDQAARDAAAKELIAEAGYGSDNPLSLKLIYNTSDSHKSVAIAISQMWKQTLGVETELANQEWQTFLETRGNQDYEIARAGWCADYNEASTFLDLMDSGSGYNDAKYNNPEVDALLAEAKTAADPQAAYTQVEQIISEDVPIIPIYHYAAAKMLSDAVEGWPYNNFQQKWYSKDLYIVAE
ncbi:peptide ABC transporter substrate-binding protein [Yoonia sediminilitoris]|uniref:Oligopeptide transport system substrate-binding protein n=1 Tax=Yoonia sediminilitoris TaxID=1286148 RepID=A0A2T6KMC4_9RHOB|nr:peptide ABC transporter substrate-binding protein [Yoonia sediminilitoris]PUB17372.1 oligopeptide transport system substrate-binding protein [Yoonia sediminilitoris]RCW97667.1 oligopeptide transport system substrate-binding protein [Yoonia sediminilitoris]